MWQQLNSLALAGHGEVAVAVLSSDSRSAVLRGGGMGSTGLNSAAQKCRSMADAGAAQLPQLPRSVIVH
jgi:hypothetical protein